MWNVSNAVCKEMFEAVLADFAKSIGVGNTKRVVIQLDQAGWHGPQNLTLPDGIRLVFQPSHSPELQPAEHLWQFVDEPLANTYFETIDRLDKVIGKRCVARGDLRESPVRCGVTHRCPPIPAWRELIISRNFGFLFTKI